jgi:hypothetical protein
MRIRINKLSGEYVLQYKATILKESQVRLCFIDIAIKNIEILLYGPDE